MTGKEMNEIEETFAQVKRDVGQMFESKQISQKEFSERIHQIDKDRRAATRPYWDEKNGASKTRNIKSNNSDNIPLTSDQIMFALIFVEVLMCIWDLIRNW